MRLLSLYSYKGKNLTEFVGLKNLTSIDLINPAIGNLNGLEQMPQLEGLELMDTRNLKDVSLIGELLTQNRPPKNIHGGRLCCKPICWFGCWAQRAS